MKELRLEGLSLEAPSDRNVKQIKKLKIFVLLHQSENLIGEMIIILKMIDKVPNFIGSIKKLMNAWP